MWGRLKTLVLVAVVGAAALVPLFGDPRSTPVTHPLWARMLLRSLDMTEAVRTMKARAVDLQTSRAYIQSISRQVKQQAARVDDMKNKEDGKRAELLEKSQSVQMLEKLEQKRRAEIEREQERKSQQMLDVLAQRMKS